MQDQEDYSLYDAYDDDFISQSKQRPVSDYENWYNDASFTEKSNVQYADNTKPPIPQKDQYENTDDLYDDAYFYYDNDEKQSNRLNEPIPEPTPYLQKRNNQIAETSEAPDSWIPPVPVVKKSTEEYIDDQNNAPPVPRKPTSRGFLDIHESSMPRSSYVPISLPEPVKNASRVKYVNIQYTSESYVPPIGSSQMKSICNESDFVKFNTVDSERGFDDNEDFSIKTNKNNETPLYLNEREIRELITKPPPLPPRNN